MKLFRVEYKRKYGTVKVAVCASSYERAWELARDWIKSQEPTKIEEISLNEERVILL